MQVSVENKKVRLYDVNQEYQVLGQVGKGTYGTVFKARNKKEKRNYAIKKFETTDPKLESQGFPVTALRQVILLKHMNHPNVIGLKQILLSKPSPHNKMRGSTFLVLQYMEHDLAGLIGNRVKFTIPEIKCIMKQMLEGLGYLHNLKIMHRDIKPANILLNDKGEIKIADFGLGRKFIENQKLTFKVVTLWYRAPELILKYRRYDHKIDVWSIGCVFAQFFTREVMFKKQNDYAQLEKILQMLGDYKNNKVPKQILNQFASYQEMLGSISRSYESKLQSYMKNAYPSITDDAIDLLSKLLDLNPVKRLSCEQALKHPFFSNDPLPCRKNQITKLQYECHEMLKNSKIKVERQQSKDQKTQNRDYNKEKDYHKSNHHKHNKNSRSESSQKLKHKSISKSDSSSISSRDKQRSRQKTKNNHSYDQDKNRKDKYYRDKYGQKDKEKDWNKDHRDKQPNRDKQRYRQREKQRERSRQKDRDKYRQKDKERQKDRDYYKNKQKHDDRDKYRDKDRERERERHKQRNRSRQRSKDNNRDYKISKQSPYSKEKKGGSPDKYKNQRRNQNEERVSIKYGYQKYQKQDEKYKKYRDNQKRQDKKDDRKEDDRRVNEYKDKDKQRDEKQHEKKYEIQIKINKVERIQKYSKSQKPYSRQYGDKQRNQRGYRNQDKYQRGSKYQKYDNTKDNKSDRKYYDRDDRYQKRGEQSRRYNRDDNRGRYDRQRQDREKRGGNNYNRNSSSDNKQQRSRSRDKKTKKQFEY